ncbi:WD40 repeat-like protein [Lentithecium fluviatile CBS 122367]|uniref:WD40 repeat-like protein n=1 Tax=Lentithecium fluviatile CBS 122367 TaxID=1168545 RepID=A0A6G1IXX2_9PLEO|nr:WD40 repeat-like protein [Lentithecium fluviatile CBS 122367]
MASSYPSTQSEHPFAATATTTPPDSTASQYPAPTYTYPLHEDSQPPSPNGISAAAILATLSDTRPPTSHAEDAQELEEEDTETGGISLESEWESMMELQPPEAPYFAHISSWDGDFANLPSFSDLELAAHSAALDALLMEPLPAMPDIPPPLPDFFVTPPPNSTHPPDLMPSAYEEHLSIQDTTAFSEISKFLRHYVMPPGTVYKELEGEMPPEVVRQEDLEGDKCDYQGIDWTEILGRTTIRNKRAAYERARLPHKASQGGRGMHRQQCHRIPKTESFFSFRRMNTTHRAFYPHFQLRNLMTATSRNDIYYATKDGVMRTDASGSSRVRIVDLRKRTVNGNGCQITTLAASNNVLIAGGFEGEYSIADLASTEIPSFIMGTIRDWSPETKSYITNHVHLFNSRSSYTPQAVFCSNDAGLRVLDCETNIFQSSFSYPSAVNCSATSPDGRMRVVVGDFQETLITNAETGQPFETLKAHADDAFACAWADDGIHVASAAQDSTIAVWDARYWRTPVALISSELAVPRVLRFSPVGSGPRVLVAAEADDYVNIINAQTFESKQVFDFFGPTAGISMTPDGQSLFVANADKRFGGIVELERTGWGEATGPKWSNGPYREDEWMDWASDDGMGLDRRVTCGAGERERRGLDLGALVV